MHENVIKTKLQICLSIMAAVAVFAIVCVFFIGVHPIVLFDMDDWRYIAEYRRPFPIWGGWNPARVFPETVMPLAGYAAAYLVKPLVGDYVLAITVTSGVIMALAVVMYYLAFKKFVISRFGDAFLIGAIALIYRVCGTLDYAELFRMIDVSAAELSQRPELTWAAILLVLGGLTKSAQFPPMMSSPRVQGRWPCWPARSCLN